MYVVSLHVHVHVHVRTLYFKHRAIQQLNVFGSRNSLEIMTKPLPLFKVNFKRSSTNVTDISSDVAILEGHTSCLPGPHPGLLQTDP